MCCADQFWKADASNVAARAVQVDIGSSSYVLLLSDYLRFTAFCDCCGMILKTAVFTAESVRNETAAIYIFIIPQYI